MKTKAFYLVILFCLSLFLNAYGSKIEQADSAYYAGDYTKAKDLYNEIIDQSGISAGLLYNLGNSYYKLGKDGEAILCYERAKKLAPGNIKIKQNLDYLTTRVNDANAASNKDEKITDDKQESFLMNIYQVIVLETGSNSWAVFAIMSFFLLLGSLCLYFFTPNVLARKTGFFSSLIFLGFTIIFVVFSFIGANQYQKKDEAILLEYSVELYKEPLEKSETSNITLHKGTKFQIVDEKNDEMGVDWLKVRYRNEKSGWIKKDKVAII